MADDLDIDALLDDLDGYCAPEADGSPAPANKADKVARYVNDGSYAWRDYSQHAFCR